MNASLLGKSFYEIYPTSYYDKNGDGIGDIKGIIDKLDYVKGMGFDGIWFNPFFDSPFLDGGYDIRDYKKIDKRFGSNADAYRLIEECHKRGLLVIFDLVAGHMSWEAPLFLKGTAEKPNEDSDYFIWTKNPWIWSSPYNLVKGLYPRYGAYMVNFFVHQPALNYGWGKQDEEWMQSPEDEGPKKTRAFIADVMKFWCSHGVDGFRCDMADSLVKNDTPEKDITQKAWQVMFGEVRKEYPNMVAVSEWSNPRDALRAGFDMDFVLDHETNFSHYFFRNALPGEKEKPAPLLVHFDEALFEKAIADLKMRYAESQEKHGLLATISGNHDTWRIASFLKGDSLKLAYLFLFTLPGTPYVYAGDELGMTHAMNYPSKDGGYQRTGSRLAMNWDEDKPNHGFSKADKKDLYLPVGKSPLSAKEALEDPKSLLHLIERLNAIRHEEAAFQDEGNFQIQEGSALVYTRGDLLVAMNLKEEPLELALPEGESLLSIGTIAWKNGKAVLKEHAGLLYKRH